MFRIMSAVTLIIGFSAVISGCATVFARVDFKYSSVAHISYSESTTTLQVDPETLVFDLSEAFRRQGVTVLDRKELDYHFQENVSGRECWEAVASIFRQEFDAYQKNSYREYSNIDRVKPFKDRGLNQQCHILDRVYAEPKTSWLLMVQFPQRSASATIYRPTSSTFFAFNGINKPLTQIFGTSETKENVGIDISSRLYLYAWRSENGRTNVYLKALPFSGQVEAAEGNSIGWTWWRVASGYEEADIVRSYKLLIEEYDRSIAH